MLRSIVSVRALVNLNLRYAISKRSVHNAKEKLQEYPEKLLKIKQWQNDRALLTVLWDDNYQSRIACFKPGIPYAVSRTP